MHKKNYYRIFAKQIRDLRYQAGLTQSEFADKLGVKQGSISKIEAGHNLPASSLLIEIRRIFKLDINKVFDLINNYK